MTTTRSAPKGLALLTLLTFGCTTVRVPASTIAPTVPIQAGVAEPQLELWIESASDVSPAESARAAADARAALRQALADRQVADRDAILVVRAQAVSRTGSRRNDQRAAVAGIAVGAVVLVAVVVVALVASKGKGGGVPKVSATARRPGAVPVVAPRPRSGAPEVGVSVWADVEVPLPSSGQPLDAPPGSWEGAYAPASDVTWDAAPLPVAAQDVATVTLPPPRPLEVEKRGFFAGDQLRLELMLVDPQGGAVRWVKSVERDVDVRDAAAVRKVLDGAFADPDGWTAR